MLYGEILENSFLDLFQTVMVFFKHLFRLRQIAPDLRPLFPRDAYQPVNIVTHHGGFGRHRRHHFQLVELGVGLFAGLLRHPRFFDFLLQIFDFVRRIVHVAKFFLNRFHLLVQVILALTLFHLLFDATANAFFDLHQIDLAFDFAHDVFDAFTRILNFENLLLLVELQRHVGGNRIRESAGIVDTG